MRFDSGPRGYPAWCPLRGPRALDLTSGASCVLGVTSRSVAQTAANPWEALRLVLVVVAGHGATSAPAAVGLGVAGEGFAVLAVQLGAGEPCALAGLGLLRGSVCAGAALAAHDDTR